MADLRYVFEEDEPVDTMYVAVARCSAKETAKTAPRMSFAAAGGALRLFGG